jgi:putative DNA primase/helicase
MHHAKTIRAADIEAAPVAWLWEERIPRGMLSLVVGRPGQGKSLFGAYLAAEVSQRAGVLFSNVEDARRQVLRPRLEAAGARLDRVHFYTPILPRDTEELAERVVAERVQLVVLDPIAAHLAVSIFNDQDVRSALSPLTQVAEETGAAIVMVGHIIKANWQGVHPLALVGGSGGGLAGAARMIYLLGSHPEDEDERVLACIKSNLREAPPSLAFEVDTELISGVGEHGRLLLMGEVDVAARQVVQTERGAKKPPAKRSAAAEFLVNYLRFGPRPAGEVYEDAKQYGVSNATLRRAASELGVVKSKPGGPDVTWRLPGELLALLAEEDGDEQDADSHAPDDSDELRKDFNA